MKDKLLSLSVKMQILMDENGQDLIEYALLAAIVALGATATMGTLATTINATFQKISTTLGAYS